MSEMNRNMELLQKFIDGELTPEEEVEALHLVADDREARDMLRFERSLFYSLRNDYTGEIEIPDHFADEVMLKIEGVNTPDAAEAFTPEKMQVFERLKHILKHILAPRNVTVKPAWVAITTLIVITAFYLLPDVQTMDHLQVAQAEEYSSPQLVAYEAETVWVRFVYFDEDAETVSVAGDFSDWEPVELSREQSGDQHMWTGMVQAEKGEQRYMFIKNEEEWVTDPFADIQRDDGFGNKNAVIYL
jgi:hypothetical protein